MYICTYINVFWQGELKGSMYIMNIVTYTMSRLLIIYGIYKVTKTVDANMLKVRGTLSRPEFKFKQYV